MPAPVGFGSNAVPPQAFTGRPQNESAEDVSSKRKDSPAHKAHAAIEAADLGEAAPANLHGKVTSAIARGIDFASLLVLQSVETTNSETDDADITGAPETDDGSADVTSPTPDPVEAFAPTEDSDDASADVDTIAEEPAATPTSEANLVDLLIEGLNDEET